MKNRLSSLLALSLIGIALSPNVTTGVLATNVSTEGPVILYVKTYLQWHPTNANYPAKAAQVVGSLYTDKTIAGSIDNHVLLPSYIAQYQGSITSQWLWASVQVVAKDPTYKFLPEHLTFISTSTDGLLNKTNTFTNPTNYYTGASRGITWGSGGPRDSDSFATGYWKDTHVNEFIFDGAASKYFLYNDGYPYSSLTNYINDWTEDYVVTLKWIFDDGIHNPVTAQITLHTKQVSPPGILGIDIFDPSQVSLGISGNTDDSWILRSSHLVNGPWKDEASIRSGDKFLRPTSPGQYYYKAVLQ